MRWDDLNIYYYPNSEGEVVLRVNTKYEYPRWNSQVISPIWTKRNRVRRIMAQQFNIARIRYTWKNVWLKGAFPYPKMILLDMVVMFISYGWTRFDPSPCN